MMVALTVEDDPNFTGNILRILNQNKISTVNDFLQEDLEKLSTLTQLKYSVILSIRTGLLNKYAASVITGKTLNFNFKANQSKRFLKTYINSLDILTGGGIPVGYITEFCGLAGCGKTQLCYQITINCITKLGIEVLYIDTKGDFSALKIGKLLHEYNYNSEDMAMIMHKIKVVRLFYMDDILDFLEKFNTINNTILRLIILDSLPSLMFQYIGDQSKVGLTQLNKLVNSIKTLCRKLDIAFICINILTRWVPRDFAENEEQPMFADQNESNTMDNSTLTKRKHRCLGNYWQHIPGLVLELNKSELSVDEEGFTDITVTIVKSIMAKCDVSCVMKLSKLGIT